jgi:hypothetical protein
MNGEGILKWVCGKYSALFILGWFDMNQAVKIDN